MAGIIGGTASKVTLRSKPPSQSRPRWIRSCLVSLGGAGSSGGRLTTGRADSFERGRILQRRQVTGLLPEIDGLDHAAQYLGVARPWQIGHEVNGRGAQRLPECNGNLVLQLFGELCGRLLPGPEYHKADQRLAL